MTASLVIKNLCYSRNFRPLWKALDYELNSGEVLQVCGINGSGKSTFLRLLAGFLSPETGTVSLNGKCIYQHRKYYQHQLHYIGHHSSVKANLTVHENIQLMSLLLGEKAQPKQIQKVLHQLNLLSKQHTFGKELSAGQLRRVGLAKLLLLPKTLWLLDEPFTSLDKEGQVFLQELIEEHNAKGGMTFLATHQPWSTKDSIWLRA